ncbi:hypothetical protein [Streptomyces sp. NPDC088847]|uniref:hypothetical protein n=1 Tax=Streptomyces sp. NPDC088847 TaxID=3365909 RepID=UPI00382464E5
MIIRTNTTITVLASSTDTDPWGDPVDSDNVADNGSATGIPASITETVNAAYGEVTTNPRVIRDGICRLSTKYAALVTDNNRIRDERTGLTWIVMDVYFPNNAIGHVPMHIDLKRS